MTRSKNSRRGLRGSNNTTRDLVGEGAHYESKSSDAKKMIRRKKRRQSRSDLDELLKKGGG